LPGMLDVTAAHRPS